MWFRYTCLVGLIVYLTPNYLFNSGLDKSGVNNDENAIPETAEDIAEYFETPTKMYKVTSLEIKGIISFCIS